MIIKNSHPTGSQSLLIQGIVMSSFLNELLNADFLNSEYFEKMQFTNDTYKEILKQSGIGNPAVMHFVLYAYLVMPTEIWGREGFELADGLFKGLNQYISTIVEKGTYSTYPKEKTYSNISYCKHIRNAVAHAKSRFNEEEGVPYVTFIDKGIRDGIECECEIKLKTVNVGAIIDRLSDIMTVYLIETLH